MKPTRTTRPGDGKRITNCTKHTIKTINHKARSNGQILKDRYHVKLAMIKIKKGSTQKTMTSVSAFNHYPNNKPLQIIIILLTTYLRFTYYIYYVMQNLLWDSPVL